MTNKDIAQTLTQMADRLQILGANRFRVIAIQNAAEAINTLGQDINRIHQAGNLQEIAGIGKGIAGMVGELLTTGTCDDLEDLNAQVPLGVVEMLQVPDMGPKKVYRLWQEMNITNIGELQENAEAGKLRVLKGFGPKSEEKILKGIALLAKRGDDRTRLGEARPLALQLIETLKHSVPAGAITKIEMAGSVRRWKETIGDVDLLVVSQQPATVMSAFQALPQVSEVTHRGETKSSVILTNSLQVDLRVVEARHWGAALQYFTGSKEHNVSVREWALKQGWSLNEYGLTATDQNALPQGTERFFEEEEALYAFLNMAWVPPELRENRGEIQAARGHSMPPLIQLGEIVGDLHGHSTWSDGKMSIAEMAETARQRGYRYWAVTDHSIGLGITGGVDSDALAQQAMEIQRLNQQWLDQGVDFRLLRGIEVEILANGDLGLPDEALAALDVVVASIHIGLRQDRETITERCLQVIRNPHVDILGHPTGRLIGSRAPSEIDMERILQACADTGTVVEINANPRRLDLNDAYARRAAALGCKIAINTDAHHSDQMAYMDYGIATARRAWLQGDHIINTRPVDEMLSLLKG